MMFSKRRLASDPANAGPAFGGFTLFGLYTCLALAGSLAVLPSAKAVEMSALSAPVANPIPGPQTQYKIAQQCWPASVICSGNNQCCSGSCSMRWKAEGKRYNNQSKRCD